MRKPYKKDKISLWETVFPLMKTAMKKCTGRMLTQCLLYILHGVFVVFVTCATQWFFDSISLSLSESTILPDMYLSLSAMVLCILLDHVLNGCQNHNSTVIHIRLIGIYQNMLNKKAGKIETCHYESQAYLKTMEKAVRASTPEGASFIIICLLNVVFCYIPYIAAMGIYLYTLHPLLILSIFLVFIPVLLSQIMKIRLYDRFEDITVQDRREYNYYEECMIGKEWKETRTLGAYPFFMERYRKAQHHIVEKEWKTQRRAARLDAVMKSMTLLGYLGILFLLIFLVLQGQIGIGAFAAVFSSVSVMFEQMDEMINSQIGGMLSRTGLTSNLVYFLSLPERGGDENSIGDHSGRIALEDVSFTYPGSQKPVLKDINLTFARETTAIVGINGAGKSTLIKLLTGIYRPDSGRVTINGLDTSAADIKNLCVDTSAVFQNYQRYKMTLYENVTISKTDSDTTQEEIYELLEAVGQRELAESLPDGPDTMLSAEFDGIELSGGQWQRIAIARALHREHEIIVLDEPTSAVDPMEEKNIYEQFSKIAKGKTAVIVTHRMSSARIADRIIVMNDGGIVEEGTHESLMKQGGMYAEMFEKQAAWYL